MPSSSLQRTTIENRIAQRVESLKKGYRQNLGILGPEGLGKTGLLAGLYRQLGRDKDILPVYVHCAALDFSDLTDRWITAVLAAVLPAPADLRDPVSAQLAVLEARLPRTVEHIRTLRKMVRRGEKNTAAAREVLGLTSLLADETRKKVVLILDEFHALGEGLPVHDPFGLLGHQIMVEKNTLYLVASSRPALAMEIFRNQLSLLFSNFETMQVSPLDAMEIARFLEARQPGLLFTEAQKKFMIRMSSGVPLYLDLLLEHMPEAAAAIPADNPHEALALPLADETLLNAVEKEIFDDHGRIAQIFQRRLERALGSVKDGAIFYHTLMAVSEGARKVPAIAAHTGRKAAECKKTLQRLVQEELLAKSSDFYFMEDALFSFWMREVFSVQKRQAVPFADERENFRLSLARHLERSDFEGPETVLACIETLLMSFRNESLQLGHKKIRLPHFNEVTIRPAGDRGRSFTASGSAVQWQGRVAFDLLHEEDVQLLAEETRETRKARKISRLRLMIALGGIDQNAKLMAQEAGIHLWLLEDLNRLFLLYNLPRLIGMRKFDGSTLGALAQSLHQA